MQVVRTPAPRHISTDVGLQAVQQAADDAQRVRSYAARTGLAGHTATASPSCPNWSRELSNTRQSVARGTTKNWNWVCAAWPGIYDDQGRLVAGLSISAPPTGSDEGWLNKLKATASEISTALGYKPAQNGDRPELSPADRMQNSVRSTAVRSRTQPSIRRTARRQQSRGLVGSSKTMTCRPCEPASPAAPCFRDVAAFCRPMSQTGRPGGSVVVLQHRRPLQTH